ncbi:MAG: hypothetical protein ACKOX6_00095 [Bdellovibrio sp.]
MSYKKIFFIALSILLFGINVFAKAACLAPWEDLHDQYKKWNLNKCSSYVYANYNPMYMSQSEDLCVGKGPVETKCLIDITEKTKVLSRDSNRKLIVDGFDCPKYDQKIMNPNIAAKVCESGTSDEYTTCVAELFQKGGLPLVSDSKPSGVSLCRSGWKKDLNACIIQAYQSGRYSGEQAATECGIAYNRAAQGIKAVDGKMTDADYERAARDARAAYNRAHGLTSPSEPQTRQAEPVQQKQQTQQQSKNSAPPASSKSSSCDVIEDLPSL